MGLVVDSGVLIAAERKARNAQMVLAELDMRFPGEVAVISVITAMELRHGAMRADTTKRRMLRERFLSEVMSVLPVQPMTTAIAFRAAEVDADHADRGIRLALPDLIIGATALEMGYSVLTANVRHFRMIVGLNVVPAL